MSYNTPSFFFFFFSPLVWFPVSSIIQPKSQQEGYHIWPKEQIQHWCQEACAQGMSTTDSENSKKPLYLSVSLEKMLKLRTHKSQEHLNICCQCWVMWALCTEHILSLLKDIALSPALRSSTRLPVIGEPNREAMEGSEDCARVLPPESLAAGRESILTGGVKHQHTTACKTNNHGPTVYHRNSAQCSLTV